MAAPSKSVRVTCEAAALVPLDELTPLQGNLKSLSVKSYERLKHSLIAHGVTTPILAWRSNGTTYILDGHQRDVVLRRMRDEDGYKVPPLPVAYVAAKNEKEAKERILLISSRYGVIEKDALEEFVKSAGLDLSFLDSTVNLPEFDVHDLILPTPKPPVDASRVASTSVKTEVLISDALLPSSNRWGFPDLRADLLSDQIPEIVYCRKGITDAAKTLFLFGELAPADVPLAAGGVLAFYQWDEKFQWMWHDPPGAVERLTKEKWGSVVAPNFSLWRDEPLVLQMYRIYQNRWCARYWQEAAGIRIIPDANWCDDRSYEWCFAGIPKQPPLVCVNCQTTNQRSPETLALFRAGLRQMVRQVEPQAVLLYAGAQNREWLEDMLPAGPRYAWLTSWSYERKRQVIKPGQKKKKADGIERDKAVGGAAGAGGEGMAAKAAP